MKICHFFIYFLFCTNIFGQYLPCDELFLSEEVDVEAKMEATKVLQFFNNEILPILNDANLDFLPTNFRAILIID
jgi:hydrogenase maturation factor HypE